MNMREQTCCFTGHRRLPPNKIPAIMNGVRSAVIRLIEQDVRYFGAGGALGFDTLAAQMILELRDEYPLIKLILVLPCEGQTKGWVAEDVTVYEQIRASADKVVCLSPHYYRGCMQQRNRHLVDNSKHCICFLTKCRGGTAYTVDYARTNSLSVVNVYESDGMEDL